MNSAAAIAMMRIPDGHNRVELMKFHAPSAVKAEPEGAPANTLGIRRIMFAVDDVVDRLRSHGAEPVGEIAPYEDIYRVCFLRGPEGIVIGLAEPLRQNYRRRPRRRRLWTTCGDSCRVGLEPRAGRDQPLCRS